MNTFTITKDLNITAYESHPDAIATGLASFTSALRMGEVLALMNVKLTDVWNSLPGLVPVKKFMNREAGLKRIFAQIQSLVPVPAGGGSDEGEEIAQPKAAQPKARKAAKQHSPAVIRETLEAFVDVTAKKLKKGKAAKKAAKPAAKAPAASGPREGSKEAIVVGLLKRKGGVTRAEVSKVTGWLEHSVGGFMSGTAKTKLGLPVESYKTESGERAYRLTGGSAA